MSTEEFNKGSRYRFNCVNGTSGGPTNDHTFGRSGDYTYFVRYELFLPKKSKITKIYWESLNKSNIAGANIFTNNYFRWGISTKGDAYTKNPTQSGYSKIFDIDKGQTCENNELQIKSTGIEFEAGTSYYLYIYSMSNVYSYHNWDGIVHVDYEVSATNCTPPATLSAPLYISGSDTVTAFNISWSGAQPGIGNPIKKYIIKYKFGSGQTFSVESETTTTSLDIPSGSARGDQCYISIQTIGEIAGYDSEEKSFDNCPKINRLPSNPMVSFSSKIVPSTGGDITISSSPGADEDADQTLSVYYKVGSSGTYQKIESLATITINNATTLYFVTFDGYEYSAAVSQEITKNIKPVLTGSCNENSYKYKSNNQYGYYGTVLSLNANKACKLKAKISLVVGTANFEYNFNNREVSSGASSQNYDIRESLSIINNSDLLSGEISWRVTFTLIDDLGEVSDNSIVSGSSRKILAVPTTVNIYNHFGDDNVYNENVGDLDNYFSDKFRIKIPYDDLFDHIQLVSVQGSSTIKSSSISSSEENNYIKADITLNSLPAATQTTFKIQLVDNTGIARDVPNFTKTYTKIGLPVIANLELSKATIKPFEATTSNVQLNLANPFPSSGVYAASINDLKIYTVGSTENESYKTIKNFNFTSSGTGYIGTIAENTMFNFGNNECNYTEWRGKQVYYILVEITDKFGNIVKGYSPKYYFNFDTAPNITNSLVKKYDTNNGEGTPNYVALGTYLVQGGMHLLFTPTFTIYTTGSYTYQLLIDDVIVAYGNGTINKSSTGRTGCMISPNIAFIPFETANSTACTCKLIVTCATTSAKKTYTALTTAKQAVPKINIISCELRVANDVKYIDVKYDLYDNGFDISQTEFTKTTIVQLYIGDSVIGELTNPSPSQNTFTFEIDESLSQETYSAYLNISTVTSEKTDKIAFELTKNKESNTLILYNISPTVSYRKHKLGINTTDIGDNNVLKIRSSSGNKFIYLDGVNSTTQDSIDMIIDMENATLEVKKNNITQFFMDFLSGELEI